jgi:hypothetical protein
LHELQPYLLTIIKIDVTFIICGTSNIRAKQIRFQLRATLCKKDEKAWQATVEPVLGTLINFMGIRRIWTRGLKNANKFMLGAVVAYNLKKWLNYTEQKRKTAVIGLKMTAEGLCLWFFAACYFIQQHNKNLPTFLSPIKI